MCVVTVFDDPSVRTLDRSSSHTHTHTLSLSLSFPPTHTHTPLLNPHPRQGDRAWDGGASISISGAFSTVASAVLVLCTIPECRQLLGLPPRRRSQRTATAANAVYDPPHTRAASAAGRPASVELSEIGTG